MYRTNIDSVCAMNIEMSAIGFEKIEKRVRFLDKAKESRSGGGSEIDKEVDGTRGGVGDDCNDQDLGKGRRIEEGSRNDGGSDSSVEFGGMVGFAGKGIEQFDKPCSSHFAIMKLVIDERRHYLQTLCGKFLNCKFMSKVPSPSSTSISMSI